MGAGGAPAPPTAWKLHWSMRLRRRRRKEEEGEREKYREGRGGEPPLAAQAASATAPAVPLTWRAGRQGAGHGSRGPDRRRHVERCAMGHGYCRRPTPRGRVTWRGLARRGEARRGEGGPRGKPFCCRRRVVIIASVTDDQTSKAQTGWRALYGVPAGLPGGSTHLPIHSHSQVRWEWEDVPSRPWHGQW